jgi:hypothetical protein
MASSPDKTEFYVQNLKKAMERICVKRLSPNAIIPSRGSLFSAGYDLSSAGMFVLL